MSPFLLIPRENSIFRHSEKTSTPIHQTQIEKAISRIRRRRWRRHSLTPVQQLRTPISPNIRDAVQWLQKNLPLVATTLPSRLRLSLRVYVDAVDVHMSGFRQLWWEECNQLSQHQFHGHVNAELFVDELNCILMVRLKSS